MTISFDDISLHFLFLSPLVVVVVGAEETGMKSEASSVGFIYAAVGARRARIGIRISNEFSYSMVGRKVN